MKTLSGIISKFYDDQFVALLIKRPYKKIGLNYVDSGLLSFCPLSPIEAKLEYVVLTSRVKDWTRNQLYQFFVYGAYRRRAYAQRAFTRAVMDHLDTRESFVGELSSLELVTSIFGCAPDEHVWNLVTTYGL